MAGKACSQTVVALPLSFSTKGICLNLETLGYYWAVFFGAILARYFITAGAAFWFSASVWKQGFISSKPHCPPPTWSLIQKDIELSIGSTVLFALMAALILASYDTGKTLLYTSVEPYGLAYMGLSFVAVLILQDTYFYFVHRLLHHPLLFRRLHYGHHRSRVPTPWTSFAFEPGEAVLQGLFFVGLVFVLPLHFATLMAALLTMTLWSIATHLGFPLFLLLTPKGVPQGLIGPAHHLVHHQRYTVHYGLYFTFWDRLLGTTDLEYEQRLDKLKGR